jgi:nucleolar protein 53
MEEKKAKEAEKMMAIKDRIGRGFVAKRSIEEGVPEGMTVDGGAEDDVEGEAGGEEAPIAKKMPERKTKQQKAKAARLRAEVSYTTSPFSLVLNPSQQKQALLEKSLKKRMLHTLSSTSIKSLRGHKSLAVDVHAQRQATEREKLRTRGMKGRRLGKHLVPEGNVDVQLGEDLSESLRALKVRFFPLFFLASRIFGL